MDIADIALQNSRIKEQDRTLPGWFGTFPFLAVWPFLSYFR
jgi:hypothetical protein